MTDPLSNPDAEASVLGAALIGYPDALLTLSNGDFYTPAHTVIAATIRDMVTRGLATDPITVTNELEARNRLHALRAVGGSAYLWKLLDGTPGEMTAPWHAAIVRAATIVREAHTAGCELAEATTKPGVTDEVHALIQQHQDRMSNIPGTLGNPDDNDAADTLGAMLVYAEKPVDWVIPGHIARGDRIVIVAGEGMSKTTMCRQMAVAYAGGLNPWSGQRVADGARVLYVDAENSRAQSARAYKWIAARAYRPTICPGWKERVVHKTRNDGVDISGRDRQWFLDLTDRVSPDVIILGPAYKLHRGDPHSERDVQNLLDVIDQVRVQHDAAVIIEAHAPHGSAQFGRVMRPFGSSAWLRWPEIVLGYQRDSDIPPEEQPAKPEYLETVDARGRREERDWPEKVRWGSPHEMPWVPNEEFWKPSVDESYKIPEDEHATVR